MKKILYATICIVILSATFLAGYWYSRQSSGNGSKGVRKVLYYVDPMNPGQKYDKPGIAPCGMALEPVYPDGEKGAGERGAIPAGMVRVTPYQQQIIGVKVEQVGKGQTTHTIRLLGKVAPDETKVYLINAAIDGWITRTYPYTTGSIVRKNETLASFYNPEFITAQQSLIYALGSNNLKRATSKEIFAQHAEDSLFSFNLKKYKDSLRSLGMEETQIEDISRTRVLTENINIISPAEGIILSRNVSDRQRFQKGAELFRIADLRKVWILLDTYENEARWFRPGEAVSFRYGGKLFNAHVSHVPPQFDPITRTLKVRLEADNPGNILRPEMFVDVEFPVRIPPTVTVPVEAIIDSGLKKTVFVERGSGLFEPRRVETGLYLGDRVEIVRGLMSGERIVVSGNFLLDSESRMKSATEPISGMTAFDPSCGMVVDQERSEGSGLTSEYEGKTYYFCSIECKRAFDKDPKRHAGEKGPAVTMPAGKTPPSQPMNGMHQHD